MPSIVFVDLDGTLVGRSGVPECAWEAIRQARNKGLYVAICTGRAGTGPALEYAQRVDLNGYHVFESGATVMRGTGEVDFVKPLPRGSYLQLIQMAKEASLDTEVYTASGGYYIQHQSANLEAHQGLIGLQPKVMPFDRVPLAEIPVRVQFIVPIYGVWEELQRRIFAMSEVSLHVSTNPMIPDIAFASVILKGVSKRTAAEWIANQYGWSLDNAAMIGDADNDKELLLAAKVAVVMGNAPIHLKEEVSQKVKTTKIVADVDDCGLAEALDYLVRIRT